MNKKTISILIITILILIFIGVVFGLEKKKVKAPVESKNMGEVKAEKKYLAEEKKEIEKIEAPEIDITNWKTYRNEEFGFEVKYPEEWGVIDEGKSNNDFTVYIGELEKYGMNGYEGEVIIASYSKKDRNIKTFINKLGSQYYGKGREENLEDIIIDGVSATRVIITSKEYVDAYINLILIERLDRIYSIWDRNGSILKTFKFIE